MVPEQADRNSLPTTTTTAAAPSQIHRGKGRGRGRGQWIAVEGGKGKYGSQFALFPVTLFIPELRAKGEERRRKERALMGTKKKAVARGEAFYVR